MKKILTLVTSALLITTPVARAKIEEIKCDCQPVASVLDAKNSATHVFVGEVLALSVAENFNFESEKEFLVRTRVKRFWKGQFEEEITVRTPHNKQGAGLQFAIGQQYLIYAVGDKSPLATACTRTAQIDHENARNDLKHLGDAKYIALPAIKVPDFMK